MVFVVRNVFFFDKKHVGIMYSVSWMKIMIIILVTKYECVFYHNQNSAKYCNNRSLSRIDNLSSLYYIIT